MGEETTPGRGAVTVVAKLLQWSLSNMGEETAINIQPSSGSVHLQWSLSNMGEETRPPRAWWPAAGAPFNGASPTWERKLV